MLYSVFNEHTSTISCGSQVAKQLVVQKQSFWTLVGLDGLEPSTSRLSGARSSHLSYRPVLWWLFGLSPTSFLSEVLRDGMGIELKPRASAMRFTSRNHTSSLFSSSSRRRLYLENGGDDGNRTHDPLLAGQVLSQLSYTPIKGYLLEGLILQNWTTPERGFPRSCISLASVLVFCLLTIRHIRDNMSVSP